MSDKGYTVFKKNWSDEQLRADLEGYYWKDWARALKAYEKTPEDFYTAWEFLAFHPANQTREWVKGGKITSPHSMFEQNLDIMVVKVNPETDRIDDRKKLTRRPGSGSNGDRG